jgi:hypothetical protein
MLMKTILLYATTSLILFSCGKPGESNLELKQGQTIALQNHPRLFFSEDEEKNILELAENEPLLSNLITVLRQEADELLTQPLQEPDNDGATDLGKSRDQIYRMVILSLAVLMGSNMTEIEGLPANKIAPVSEW